MKSDLVFQIFNAIKSNDEKSGIAELDRTTQELLRSIADEFSQGRILHVGDIVQRRDIGSAPSIYLKLKTLSETGWIETTADNIDGRYKKVIPTKRTVNAFKAQSKSLKTLLAKYS